MSCNTGLNNILTANVPANNGDGADLDVSSLAAKKTIYLSGIFDGLYTILGSQDDVRFVPIARFEGQATRFGTSGPQTVKKDIKMTIKTIKVQRAADRTVNIAIAGQATCPC